MSPAPPSPRIVYSMFAPAALGEFLATHYFDGRTCDCELLSRSWTDVYRLRVDGVAYAGRVWRHGFHERAALEGAADLLRQLRRGGRVRAPLPVRGADGACIAMLAAPEGERPVAVFDWLEGAPVGRSLSSADAHRCGAMLAQLHLEARELADATQRATCWHEARARLAPLARVVAARDPEAPAFVDAVARVLARVEQLEDALPGGMIHGDFHQNNVLRTATGELAVIDFDDAGPGAWLRDVAAFAWALEFLRQPREYLDAFLQGYGAVRPITAGEREALPWFLAERDCWSLLGWAVSIDVIGDPNGALAALLGGARTRFAALGV